jgi:uncharacterized cupin superfamily protein
MTEEARLEETGSGVAPATEGWFVVNVRDAAWFNHPTFGAACRFEGREAPFREVGINIRVLQPGQPCGLYHAESQQEGFLVLSGECMLLVEGEERPLRAWDFVHCPPRTAHIVVGAGEGPAVVLMTGSRSAEWNAVYPASELARRHGASAAKETSVPIEAYEGYEYPTPGRPPGWERLPWA